MRAFWPLSGSLLALAALWPATVVGQNFDDDPNAPQASSLVAKLHFVQYGILSGRIVAMSAQSGASMSYHLVHPGRTERVSIDVTSGLPNVRYEMSSTREELLIELADSDELTVRRVAKDTSRRGLEFHQPHEGDVVLSIDQGSQSRRIAAASLWHLALAEPDLCRKELFPLVELLRPSWHLSPVASATEEALVRWAAAARIADRRQWQAWTDALASPKFAEREAAERLLLDAGPAVLPFLERLDRQRLDAEQRSRLRNLIAVLDDAAEDTVDRVVTWLAADRQPWLSLLGRSERSTRDLAARQLAQLVGGPIDFDPAADEQTRAAQLARLRARLSGAAAAAAPAAAAN